MVIERTKRLLPEFVQLFGCGRGKSRQLFLAVEVDRFSCIEFESSAGKMLPAV